jgi:hypothetical protein
MYGSDNPNPRGELNGQGREGRVRTNFTRDFGLRAGERQAGDAARTLAMVVGRWEALQAGGGRTGSRFSRKIGGGNESSAPTRKQLISCVLEQELA